MVYKTSAQVEQRIKRLSKEISEIDKFFYGSNEEKDRFAYMTMLEFKRDDVVRSAVLQMHTSIEDLMTKALFNDILGPDGRRRRTKRAKSLERILGGPGAGFDRKLHFAVLVGLINSNTRDKLSELNTIRNRCSHNWLLNTFMPGKKSDPKKKKQKKPRLLAFRNRDLHKVAVLKGFITEYGRIYINLWLKYA